MTQKQPLKSLLLRLLTVTALYILSTTYAVAADDKLSLDDAIEQSVEELSAKLKEVPESQSLLLKQKTIILQDM